MEKLSGKSYKIQLTHFCLCLLMMVGCTQEKSPTAPEQDIRPPTIQWIAPAAGSILSGTASLQFSIHDQSNVDSARVFKNGYSPLNWLVSSQSDSGWTVSWDTRSDEDGFFIIEVRAWDQAGNMGISPSLVVRVQNHPPGSEDRTPPEIWWESPSAGSTLSGSVVMLLRFTDASGVDSIRLTRNGAAAVAQSTTADSLAFTWDTASDSDGVHVWEARGWDGAGNMGSSPALLVRVQNHQPPREDRSPPVAAWVAPESGSELAGIVNLRFQILDDVGVDSVRVFKNGRSPVGFYLPGHAYLEYELNWNTSTDPDGIYLLEVRAWDASGNLGVSPGLVVTVANHPPQDRTPPDVWWIYPDAGATLQDTVILRLRVFDESGVDSVHLYLNGVYRSAGVPAGNDWAFLWDTRSDSDGVHLWEARAWDAAGNEGRSSVLLVRVQNHEPPPEDRTPPVITWRSPELGDTLAGMITLRVDALDDDRVDSLRIYVNGARSVAFGMAGHENVGYEAQWDTRESPDGVYHLEARAWDRSDNLGFSEPLAVTVWNNRPRVIWVPDEYEAILEAIRASKNGDTVRVREGVYEEHLQMFDKNIWLESESGPESTIIDGTDAYTVIWIEGGQDTTAGVRGFTIRNDSDFNCLNIILYGAHPKILNNVFTGTNSYGGVQSSHGEGIIRNNLTIDVTCGASIGYSWGDFSNNMVVHTTSYAFWNAANHAQPLRPSYNLFWDYGALVGNQPINWGDGNIFDREPLFRDGSYRLRENSPGVDEGRTDLRDLDGSRSDIGVYGGPLAYPPE